MHVMLFVAAGASVLLSGALGANSGVVNLLNVSWILAPYLVLTAVMVVVEKRTSLLATAVATLFGAAGALTPVVVMTLFEGRVDARIVPICQAAAVALLVPACRWVIARIDAKPPASW